MTTELVIAIVAAASAGFAIMATLQQVGGRAPWPGNRLGKSEMSDEEFAKDVAQLTARPFSSAGRSTIRWNCWRFLAHPGLTKELRVRLNRKVQPHLKDVDAVCILSLGADQLVRPLQMVWRKPIMFPQEFGRWALENPHKKRLAIADIAFHEGFTLMMALDEVAKAELQVMSLWMGMYNDIESESPGAAKKLIEDRGLQDLVVAVLKASDMVKLVGYIVGPSRGQIEPSEQLSERAKRLDEKALVALVASGTSEYARPPREAE